MDLVPPAGYINLKQCKASAKVNIYVLALEDAQLGTTQYGDHDVYLHVGDYTSKTKQDPLFLHIYSKRADILQYILSKLVARVIINLQEVRVSGRYGEQLFANDKYGCVDIVYSPDALTPDHAEFCRMVFLTTIPLCSLISGKQSFPNVFPAARTEHIFPRNSAAGSNAPVEFVRQKSSASTVATTPIRFDAPPGGIRLNEVSLQVKFDPEFNFRDLISGLNVGWTDFGIVNDHQYVIFFGCPEEIVKIQHRFQLSVYALKELNNVDRTLTFQVWASEDDLSLLK